MATATKKPTPPPPPPKKTRDASQDERPKGPIVRAFDAVYRFLASLKLAVISLTTLALVLSYATFFESWYGTSAVQQYIYQSPLFALLLAFLGINILCAALIRYPWTKRQTGFVITHAGLLVVLLGSWISFLVTDDGQVSAVEGGTARELVRIDHAAFYVQPVDPESGTPDENFQYKLPFHAGAFPWENAERAKASANVPNWVRPAAMTVSGLAGLGLVIFLGYWAGKRFTGIHPLVGGSAVGGLLFLAGAGLIMVQAAKGPRIDVLSRPDDPFRLAVLDYLPASTPPQLDPLPAPEGGIPMLKPSLRVQPPGSEPIDVFKNNPTWLIADNPRLRRDTTQAGPAQIAFQYVETQEQVDDFLHLPPDPLKDEQARIHYTDASGKPRVYEMPINEAQVGQTVTLPDSELSVRLVERGTIPVGMDTDHTGTMQRAVGDSEIHVAQFKVRKGDGPEVTHYGWGSLPMIPSVIPTQSRPDEDPLVRVSYYHPPHVGQVAMQGTSGVIEVIGTPEGKLYYRAFGREGLRGKGPLKEGKLVDLVGGPNQPMSVSFGVQEYYPSALENYVCKPLDLPKGQMGNGIPAALVELTVDGVRRRTRWVRRSQDFTPRYATLTFPDKSYRVSLDFDRKILGFSLKLVDFEVGMDPGTNQASSYVSDVLLTDPEKGIKDKPITISMNEPLTHRGYTFYQSNYIPHEDGVFESVFQTRYDPVWGIIYSGCLLVVLGTFVQFYMRAGVFTDGGKRERERADRRARDEGSTQQPSPIANDGETAVAPAPKTDAPAVEDL